jgi:mannose-6-phosphate isomerase-like protein (cupin superfamily)
MLSFSDYRNHIILINNYLIYRTMKKYLHVVVFFILLSFTVNSISGQYRQDVRPPAQGIPTGIQQEEAKAKPLAERIGHNDKSQQREYKGVHAGPGSLNYQTLLGAGTIKDLVFMHCGPINPKSGIGHHFHYLADEMFLILDGEAEFTINGHTSLIKGPAGVPVKAGNSHAIYNPTDKPVNWLNFQVKVPWVDNPYGSRGFGRGAYDYSADPGAGAFNMNDGRVGVTLEEIPTFKSTFTMTKDLMRPVVNMNGGRDTVFYRRALGSAAFASNWSAFDHYYLPPKASIGRHFHPGVDEIYLVSKGSGRICVDDEIADIVWGDAIPVYAGEIHSIENTSDEPLELLVYAVAYEKGKLDEVSVPLEMTKLQMFFEIPEDKCQAFEDNYRETYIPALRQQTGYMGSKLIRLYPTNVLKSIGAARPKYNYQMELLFDTEENRVKWTQTDIHNVAWGKTKGMAKNFEYIGYDVVGMDQTKDPIGDRSITTEKKY